MASDYIEGTLPPAMTEAMRAHASACASCRSDAEALRGLSRELNLLPTVDPPLFFRENVIAAIERQESGRPVGPWWRTMLPHLGRVAMGTALTGGAVAAAAWMLLLPGTLRTEDGMSQAGVPAATGGVPFANNLLPGASAADPSAVNAAASTPAAYLRVARVTSMLPGTDGPSYDFSFWLENAQKGTARWHFVGDKTAYRFNLSGNTAQTVRIPYSAAQGRDSLALYVYWTADAAAHARYLLLPVPRNADRAPEERQSFGLPEETIVEAARHIAARYGTPVTLEDVPADLRVRITARDETAVEALERSLTDLGLKVTASRAGILVSRDKAGSSAVSAGSTLTGDAGSAP
jgi:hypothetical protein